MDFKIQVVFETGPSGLWNQQFSGAKCLFSSGFRLNFMAAQYTHANLFTSNHLKKQRGTLLCHLKMFLETRSVATRLHVCGKAINLLHTLKPYKI